MGHWEHTTYVAHPEAATVAAVILELFAEEGMRRLMQPAERSRQPFEPMQYGAALENNEWSVAAFPGSAGWTIVKTAPLELLGERAPGKSRMRLVEVAARLKAEAVQINLYDGSAMVLVEVDRVDQYRLSGYKTDWRQSDPLSFNGEPLSEERIEVLFELLPLQAHIDMCGTENGFCDNEALAGRLAAALGGDNAGWCDNIVSVDHLICRKPLPMVGGIDLHVEWPARDRSDAAPRRAFFQAACRAGATQ
jgi:hypothetical protein